MFVRVFKRFGIPLLAGMVVLGCSVGFMGSKAYAASTQQAVQNPAVQSVQTGTVTTEQNAKEQNTTEQTPAYTASIFLGQQDNGQPDSAVSGNDNNDAALASKAKITVDEAISAVKAAYPGNAVQGGVIGDENGYLIYEVKMTDKAGKSFDVKVDAGNAAILATDSNSGDAAELNGSSEQQNEPKGAPEEASQGTDADNVEVEE